MFCHVSALGGGFGGDRKKGDGGGFFFFFFFGVVEVSPSDFGPVASSDAAAALMTKLRRACRAEAARPRGTTRARERAPRSANIVPGKCHAAMYERPCGLALRARGGDHVGGENLVLVLHSEKILGRFSPCRVPKLSPSPFFGARRPPQAMTTYLWVDCDPGHDDAFALILACHSANPAVIVAGVSTVCGNQTVDKTTDNALRVLHLLGRDDVQVHKGADKPLIRNKRTCPEIHGDTGLDGPDIPAAPRACNPLPPVVAMANAFERVSQIPSARMVLVATGALTNVALFCAVYPELATHVELTFMGGALGRGNTGPTAEFNIQCDPEAASGALNHAFKKISMVPLETTHRALATPSVRRRIRIGPTAAGGTEEADDSVGGSGGSRATTRFRALADELLMFFGETYEKVFGFEDPPLHDPCAVFLAIAPERFRTEKMRVDVECAGALTAGTTVVDWWRQSPEKPLNVDVVVDMDVPAFWEAMCVAVDNASAACPLR